MDFFYFIFLWGGGGGVAPHQPWQVFLCLRLNPSFLHSFLHSFLRVVRRSAFPACDEALTGNITCGGQREEQIGTDEGVDAGTDD